MDPLDDIGFIDDDDGDDVISGCRNVTHSIPTTQSDLGLFESKQHVNEDYHNGYKDLTPTLPGAEHARSGEDPYEPSHALPTEVIDDVSNVDKMITNTTTTTVTCVSEETDLVDVSGDGDVVQTTASTSEDFIIFNRSQNYIQEEQEIGPSTVEVFMHSESHDAERFLLSDDGNVPAYDDCSVPAHDEGSVPAHDEGSVPAHDDGSISAHDDGSIPAYDDGSVPVHDDGSEPDLDDGSVPAHDEGSDHEIDSTPVGDVCQLSSPACLSSQTTPVTHGSEATDNALFLDAAPIAKQDTAPELVVKEDTASELISKEDIASELIVNEDTAQELIFKEDTAPELIFKEDTVSELIIREDSVPELNTPPVASQETVHSQSTDSWVMLTSENDKDNKEVTLDELFGESASLSTNNNMSDLILDTSLKSANIVCSDTDREMDFQESLVKESFTEISEFRKESSPTIVLQVDTPAAEDATVVLPQDHVGNGLHLQHDSLEDEVVMRRPANDQEMDFTVFEPDTAHLNVEASKQRRSLCKRGSLARRKKPSRNSMANVATDTPDGTDPDAEADTTPDHQGDGSMVPDEEVFEKELPAAQIQDSPASEIPTLENKTPESEARRPRSFKPPMLMPGLLDLKTSKLFNQERQKSEETTTSPKMSPTFSSPTSKQASPPQVLPKPSMKGQRNSDNITDDVMVLGTVPATESSIKPLSPTSISEYSGVGARGTETMNIPESVLVLEQRRTDDTSVKMGVLSDQSQKGGDGTIGMKIGRSSSIDSSVGAFKLSRGDSTSSEHGHEFTSQRKSSFSGSAYTPIAFRPRRSSSTVLESDSKVFVSSENQLPTSPTTARPSETSPLSPTGLKPQSESAQEPTWFSELKAESGPSTRATIDVDGREGEHSFDYQSKTVSEESSVDNKKTIHSEAKRKMPWATSEELVQKIQLESKREKPIWMRAAVEKTSRVAEQLQVKPYGHENGNETTSKTHVSPWNVELKKTVSDPIHLEDTKTDSPEKASMTPARKDLYVPSWLKTGQQLKKTPTPSVGPLAHAANGNDSGSQGNPMKAYETPKWKLDLAERKKQREAKTMPVDAIREESQPSETPLWQQQLGLRKKNPVPTPNKVEAAPTEGPVWTKQAEERRSRLMKQGIIDNK